MLPRSRRILYLYLPIIGLICGFFIYDTPFRHESRPYITLCDTLIRIVILYHHYLSRRYTGTIIISLLHLYFYKKNGRFHSSKTLHFLFIMGIFFTSCFCILHCTYGAFGRTFFGVVGNERDKKSLGVCPSHFIIFSYGWTVHQMRGGVRSILLLLLSIAIFFFIFFFTSMERKESNGWGHIFFGFFFFSLQISQTFWFPFLLGNGSYLLQNPYFPFVLWVFSFLVIIITLLS